jgi:hypothetical protein
MVPSYYDPPNVGEGSDYMRGPDEQTSHMFSYVSPEQRLRANHSLRAIRVMTDRVFAELSPRFPKMYSDIGRPPIPPEQLPRVLVFAVARRFPTSLVPLSFIMAESSTPRKGAT